jgi:N-acetylmuramic acid 6-phosphate etherase
MQEGTKTREKARPKDRMKKADPRNRRNPRAPHPNRSLLKSHSGTLRGAELSAPTQCVLNSFENLSESVRSAERKLRTSGAHQSFFQQSARTRTLDARITERENPASIALDTKSTWDILSIINREDEKVARAIRKVIPQIAKAVDLIAEKLEKGGRLIYLGAGTSGRLGVLDAAECIPTFATDKVVGIMAGAPQSMFRPSELSEDDPQLAVRDLRRIRFGRCDVLVGISASGRTPYVIHGMKYARRLRAPVVALTANPEAEMKSLADIAIVPIVGPEVVSGSTRMKAGTAQKLVLNMLSTASMVRLGRVFSNLMINVQLTNAKLRRRAELILARTAGVSVQIAARTLADSGDKLPVALLMLWKNIPRREALRLLSNGQNTASALHAAAEGRQFQ